MRIEVNKPLAERNRRYATIYFVATLVFLIGGFILYNLPLFTDFEIPPILIVVQLFALPVAFLLVIVSVRMTNLWSRQPYPENAMREGIKGLSKRSIFYHYYHLPARHVLIAPQGVFTITTRWHTGKYSVKGNDWSTQQNIILRFASLLRMDNVGNPTEEAKLSAKYVEQLLEDIAPDVEVQPVILFLNPNAEVTIEEPEVPVVFLDEKKSPSFTDYLRSLNKAADQNKKPTLPLTDEQIEAFEEKTLPDRPGDEDEEE